MLYKKEEEESLVVSIITVQRKWIGNMHIERRFPTEGGMEGRE